VKESDPGHSASHPHHHRRRHRRRHHGPHHPPAPHERDERSPNGRDDEEKKRNEAPQSNAPDQDQEQRAEEAETPKELSPEERRKKERRKWILIIGGAVVLLIALAIAIPWWLHARHFEDTDDAFIDSRWEHAAPQVAGRVLRVLVTDNQRVEAGQTLIEIDPADYRVRVEQATATLSDAKSKLTQAQANVNVATAAREQAKADVDQAKAVEQNAISQLKRYQGLSREAVSQQRLDDLRTAAINATAQRVAMEKKMDAAEAQVGVANAQVVSSRASIEAAQSQLDQAKLNLSYTTVKAALAGRLMKLNVQAGDYLQPGQEIAMIVPNDLWVTANFKETQLTDMRPGQPVTIEVDAFPDVDFRGHVDSVQAGSGAATSLLPAENATGNYVKVVQRVPVKIVFDDQQSEGYQRLAPGMSVTPKVRVR
jgi:membrane fusion protein (multidrug efflux system)